MASNQRIEIVTIYNVARTRGGRKRVRALSALSLLVAAFWLYHTQGTVRLGLVDSFTGGTTAYNWLGVRVGAAMISAGSVGMEATTNPWEAIGLVPPPKAKRQPRDEQWQAAVEESQQQAVILGIEREVWVWTARVAGSWLALAAIVGMTGRRAGLTMLRQAAYLMILSTIVSVAGIYVAIRWGGMPPDADLPLYLKIFGVQSAYAWFLLIATRLFR